MISTHAVKNAWELKYAYEWLKRIDYLLNMNTHQLTFSNVINGELLH